MSALPCPRGRNGGSGAALGVARGGIFTLGDNKLEGKGMSMETLANTLTPFIGLPTVNATDTNKFYDFSFNLAPEDYQSMMVRAAAARGVAYPPELLTQLQSMSPGSLPSGLDKAGLKLEKDKAPLEVINIDELKKVPTEN